MSDPSAIDSFVLRAAERGYNKIPSTGPNATYVAGHPDAFITRYSSFNFHEYQEGRPHFGQLRVFGDEVFNGAGCGYNMHPHHNFVICAFVLQGTLTHVNTIGKVDRLSAGDYYVFSAGSGGKHAELNIEVEPAHIVYVWLMPDRLMLPPSYRRAHFDAAAGRNRIVTLVGTEEGALPIPQDFKVSRLASDGPTEQAYTLRSPGHGVYAFVLEGALECAGVALKRRDSLGIRGIDRLVCRTGKGNSDVLLVETAM
jgi:quercetin 2,3-dioxygenase